MRQLGREVVIGDGLFREDPAKEAFLVDAALEHFGTLGRGEFDFALIVIPQPLQKLLVVLANLRRRKDFSFHDLVDFRNCG
ncbi:MAG: hypothetical protein ABMA26_07230 [Limisphaerales bacterium]